MSTTDEKYRCIKVPLSYILKSGDKETQLVLQDAIDRTNKIVSKSYLLLRLWVLKKYHSNVEIPLITEDTIRMSMKSFLEKSRGPKPKDENKILLDEFTVLKDEIDYSLESGLNLSSILRYYSTTILTAIENNIKYHFMDYIKRFINQIFLNLPENKEKIQDPLLKKEIFKELNCLKNDIINNTTTCVPKYHQWLLENRNKIVPSDYDTSYYYDLKINPQKYLKYMIFMISELEKITTTSIVKDKITREKKEISHSLKLFQFFPLQTDIITKHVVIDTASLIDLLIPENKKEFLDNIMDSKEEIWSRVFYINSKKLRLRKYLFDYTIITDGYSVSLRFLHRDQYFQEQTKKTNKQEGKRNLIGLTKEEKMKIREEKSNKQEEIKQDKKKIRDRKNKEQIEYEKTLTKEQLKELKDFRKEEQTRKQITEQEFQYIEDVPKEFLTKEINPIFIDPGKRALLTMLCNNKFLSYTNRERLSETKRLKYQNILKNLKLKLGITDVENLLSNYNSKTSSLTKFKEYIKQKLFVNEKLFEKYKDIKFRQYKWYSYINRRRSEDNILNKIEKTFKDQEKETIIIIGDWSIGKQMSNFISTPNLTIKRKLKERFKVYNIDEFRTSCLNSKTEEYCDNLYLPDKIGKVRKIHSILTFKMENQRKGCINRDKNGCLNIKKIFDSYIKDGTRPLRYQRSYKIEDALTTPSGSSNRVKPEKVKTPRVQLTPETNSHLVSEV